MFAGVKIHRFFLWSQQIKQKRGKSSLVERLCDKLVPRTVSAAPAAVRKQHECDCLSRDTQISLEHRRSRWNLNLTSARAHALALTLPICRRFSSMSKSRNLNLERNVSGNSPSSQTLVLSNGSTARVLSM